MDGKKSKFEHSDFSPDFWVAVNKDKFTEQQAIEILEKEYEQELGSLKGEYYIESGFVRHGAGVTDDGEPRVCWWLEWKERKKGSVPVYAFTRRWKDNEN